MRTLLAAGLLLSSSAMARAAEPAPIKLYDHAPGMAGSTSPEIAEPVFGSPGVRNIGDPTLIPVLPPAGHATGAAVIVAPGGGYRYLAIDTEGLRVAHYLADHGIAAFVLKYRTKPTPRDPAAFMKQIMADLAAASRDSAYVVYDDPEAVADGQAAVRLVRARAAGWGIDPRRVGMLGFSAGAITALKVATGTDVAARPDFVASIYGPLEAIPAPADAPPAFVASAMDDGTFGGRGYGLLESWRRVKRPLEFHLYERSGHGFGLGREGTTTADWPAQFLSWLRMHGVLTPR